MRIRRATIDEAERVVDLYSGYSGPAYPKPSAERIRELFAAINSSGYVAIAESEGQIIGTYSMYFCANLAKGGMPFAVIENVIVSASWRRQGVGRALMNHAQAAAREAGCYKVMLCTAHDNDRNRKFYEACGFIGNKTGFQVRYVG